MLATAILERPAAILPENPWTEQRATRQERLRDVAEQNRQELDALLPMLTPGTVPNDWEVELIRRRAKALYDAAMVYLTLRERERSEA